jgi:hypothetical protein
LTLALPGAIVQIENGNYPVLAAIDRIAGGKKTERILAVHLFRVPAGEPPQWRRSPQGSLNAALKAFMYETTPYFSCPGAIASSYKHRRASAHPAFD